MNEEDLRDCFAMFAMLGFITDGSYTSGITDGAYTSSMKKVAQGAYEMADEMLEARKPKESAGLPAIRRRTKKGE
jgi:hypothetical protein